MINSLIANPVNSSDYIVNLIIDMLNVFCKTNNISYGSLNMMFVTLALISLGAYTLGYLFSIRNYRKISLILGGIGLLSILLFIAECFNVGIVYAAN